MIFNILLKQIHAGNNLRNEQVCFDEITCNNFKFETIQAAAELLGDAGKVYVHITGCAVSHVCGIRSEW